MRTDGVEPSQREASRLQRGELTGCSASARRGRATDRIRTGTARITTSDAAVTPRPPRICWNGDDRARTGDLSPDKRVLYPSELRPLDIAKRGWDSNPRSRAHEAREDSLSSTARRSDLAGRSRTCGLRRPKSAGWPAPLQPVGRAPPAGLEPATSGLRARRHCRFDHGGRWCLRAPVAGIEPAISRVTTARLANSTTPERKERESNPQGCEAHPFSRRDTAPVAVLPESDPGRRRTCNRPGKNRELCRLSYGASANDVTGRTRTCHAPRFRRALYRLSYGHVRVGGRSRSRTGGLLRIREALFRLSYPPSIGFMGKAGFEPAATVRVRHVLYR